MLIQKRILWPSAPAGGVQSWVPIPDPSGVRAVNATGTMLLADAPAGANASAGGAYKLDLPRPRGQKKPGVQTIAIGECSHVQCADIYPGGRISPENRFRIAPGAPLVRDFDGQDDDTLIVAPVRGFKIPAFANAANMYWGAPTNGPQVWPPLELAFYRGELNSPLAFNRRAPLEAQFCGRTTQAANFSVMCAVCVDGRHSWDVEAIAYNFQGATTSATLAIFADDAAMELGGTAISLLAGGQQLATISGGAGVSLAKEYQGKGYGIVYVTIVPNNPGTGTCDFQVRVSADDED